MEFEEFSIEHRRRYDLEEVAQFIELALERQPPTERAKWSWLPEGIRQHWAPFFYARPSTQIVDLVRRPARDGSP